MVPVLIFLCLCALSIGQKDGATVVAAINNIRGVVDPPCDYRPNEKGVASPCTGTRGNKLPGVTWDAKLVTESKKFSILCKFTANPNVPKEFGQILYVSFAANVKTDEALILDAVEYWGSIKGYDGATGAAEGSSIYYKQLVSANALTVGCSAQQACPNNGKVVVCTFGAPPPAGPAYPVLTATDPVIKKSVQDQGLFAINLLRTTTTPKPRQPLSALKWDDELAKQAQLAVDQGKVVNGNGQLTFTADSIVATPATSAVLHWSATRRNFRFHDGLCGQVVPLMPRRRRRWGRRVRFLPSADCHHFTQLVNAATTKVGCAQGWKNGKTTFVCRFNHGVAPVALGRPLPLPFKR